MQKNHFIQLIPSLNAVNFRFMRPEWPNPFLIMHNPKIFQTILTSQSLYQHTQNQVIILF